MSGNKLLAENTVRRFMKLANVHALTDNFIAEGGMKYVKKDDPTKIKEEEEITEEEETEQTIEEQEEPEEELEMDAELGSEEPEMDMDPEMDMGVDEPGAADISLTEEEASLLIDLGARLAAAMDEGSEDPDVAPSDEEVPPMDDEMAAEEPEEEEEEEDPVAMQEELVNEVLRRVTKRLVEARRNRK